MSASSTLHPLQFASAARAATAPPVTPPTSAPVSSGTTPNAATMWSYTKATQTAASQSEN